MILILIGLLFFLQAGRNINMASSASEEKKLEKLKKPIVLVAIATYVIVNTLLMPLIVHDIPLWLNVLNIISSIVAGFVICSVSFVPKVVSYYTVITLILAQLIVTLCYNKFQFGQFLLVFISYLFAIKSLYDEMKIAMANKIIDLSNTRYNTPKSIKLKQNSWILFLIGIYFFMSVVIEYFVIDESPIWLVFVGSISSLISLLLAAHTNKVSYWVAFVLIIIHISIFIIVYGLKINIHLFLMLIPCILGKFLYDEMISRRNLEET